MNEVSVFIPKGGNISYKVMLCTMAVNVYISIVRSSFSYFCFSLFKAFRGTILLLSKILTFHREVRKERSSVSYVLLFAPGQCDFVRSSRHPSSAGDAQLARRLLSRWGRGLQGHSL